MHHFGCSTCALLAAAGECFGRSSVYLWVSQDRIGALYLSLIVSLKADLSSIVIEGAGLAGVNSRVIASFNCLNYCSLTYYLRLF